MTAPELPPPRSSLPEAASRFGAHLLASAAAHALDMEGVTGGPPGTPSLPAPPVTSASALAARP
ncbi:2-methylisoborneol synthase, partial [Streptomyces sp. NPDC053705]